MQFLRTTGRVLGNSTLRRLNTGHVRVSAVPLRTFLTLQTPKAPTFTPAVCKAPLKNFQGVFTKRFSSTVAIPHVEKVREATQVVASKPIVAYWLYFNAGLIFAIVVVGGLTRLTESGLSITEWNVISGMKPPRSQAEWEEEFEKYKQFPEYKILNRHMNLEEFKNIFYWEWSHRMLGRFIGSAFIIPGLYFASRGYMTKKVAWQTFGISAMLGFQGFMGWYMVKSGLSQALMKEPGAVPRVSQYRLTAHLATAFIIYGSTVMVAADVIRQHKLANGTLGKDLVKAINNPALNRLRAAALFMTCFVFMTAMTGGLVAGLDAGLIYNEWPMMGEGLVPPTNELWSDDFVKPGDNGKWRNFLENPTTVQFDHRTMAETAAVLSTALWYYSRRLPVPRSVRVASNAMMAAVVAQVTLGVTTLIYMVPIQLAALHQAGALTLLTTNFWLLHSLKKIPV
ncbi:hypothetical protein INT44_004027, partial [Umbelopsis vinacea]